MIPFTLTLIYTLFYNPKTRSLHLTNSPWPFPPWLLPPWPLAPPARYFPFVLQLSGTMATNDALSSILPVEAEISDADPTQLIDPASTIVVKLLLRKPLARQAILSTILSTWGSHGELQIHFLSNDTFRCTFTDPFGLHLVQQGGPWSIGGNLAIIEPWVPSIPVSDLAFSKISFWIQLHCIPRGYLTDKIGWKLVNRFATPLKVIVPNTRANPARQDGWFLRVLSQIDISQPLRTGLPMTLPDGSKTWVTLKYEKLSVFCYFCGILSHDEATCKQLYRKEQHHLRTYGPCCQCTEIKQRMYGPWLRSNTPISLPAADFEEALAMEQNRISTFTASLMEVCNLNQHTPNSLPAPHPPPSTPHITPPSPSPHPPTNNHQTSPPSSWKNRARRPHSLRTQSTSSHPLIPPTTHNQPGSLINRVDLPDQITRLCHLFQYAPDTHLPRRDKRLREEPTFYQHSDPKRSLLLGESGNLASSSATSFPVNGHP